MSKKGIHINKQRWKIFLAFMVLIVIAGTLLLSNGFISKIAQSEKDKAMTELEEEDKELWYKCICGTKKGFVVGGT